MGAGRARAGREESSCTSGVVKSWRSESGKREEGGRGAAGRDALQVGIVACHLAAGLSAVLPRVGYQPAGGSLQLVTH
jgi:hypothetical protein